AAQRHRRAHLEVGEVLALQPLQDQVWAPVGERSRAEAADDVRMRKRREDLDLALDAAKQRLFARLHVDDLDRDLLAALLVGGLKDDAGAAAAHGSNDLVSPGNGVPGSQRGNLSASRALAPP